MDGTRFEDTGRFSRGRTAAKEMAVVAANLVELMMAEDLQPWSPGKKVSVDDVSESQKPDGSWPDLPYDDPSGSSWKLSLHLGRLLMMAKTFRAGKRGASCNHTLEKHILRGTDFWCARNFQSPDWWHNCVSIPETVGKIFLLMGDRFSGGQKESGLEIMKRAWPGPWYGRTGQNMIWLAEATIMRCCVEKNADLFREAVRAAAGTLTVTCREGIQADFSFYQHGPQLYNGGYGWDFVHDAPRLAWAFRGTSYAFTPDEIAVLSKYMLDAIQWMMRGRTLDYFVQGRELVRRQNDRKYLRLLHACGLMVQLKPPRQAEFKRLRDRLIDGAVNGPIGNRHFWHGDYMVHRREGFMVSVRMNSLRVLNTEVLHDENLQNAHQADGVMQILRTGREYEGILPVWDWRRLPGITCRREPGPLKPARVDLEILRKTRFVGGVSDGTWGLAAFDFRREGLIGRKSWFCFDREIVCLGAGISCSTGNPVVTSVNQSLLRTKILIADERSRKEQKAGRTSIDGIRWVHHDATGYLFIGAHRVTAASEMQRGSWHDLSAHYPEEETVRNRVFSLWIEHGENPEGGSYAYAVLPGIKVREMDRYQENLPVRILSNLPELQAVHHEGIRLTQIAFYGSGELQIPEGPVVSVDRPCLIMLHRTGKGFNLSVSNPENEPCTVNVAISARLTGPGCRWHGRSRAVNVRVELPSGIHAGRSVVVPLERWKS